MIKTKKQMFIVIGVFTLVMLLGTVTYAFFNYTRTGQANNIRTGQIHFLTTQGNTLNLTDLFPVASNEVGNNNAMTLRIEGSTSYSGGEEFEITFDSVNNTVNNKVIPINYIASYAPTSSGENVGSQSNNYFSERGSTTAVYDLTETGIVEEGKQILVGYIPVNGDIDGTLTIRAYLDSGNIAITDTLEGTEPASAEYENGTTSTWVDERVVMSTQDWNSLNNSNNPLSFRIKAVSQEGTWVENPDRIPTMDEMCPGCRFMYTTNSYYSVDGGESTLSDIEYNGDTLYDDYNDVIAGSGKNYFLGVKINSTTNKIEKAYACGIKSENPNNGTPFCIEKITTGFCPIIILYRPSFLLFPTATFTIST